MKLLLFNQISFLLVLGIGIFNMPLYGQTGPGGVGETNGTSELVLWLDAGDLGLSDGAEVSTWLDNSGYGNDATGASGNRPDFSSSWTNLRSAVSFASGDEDYLTIPNSVSTQFDHHTVFIIGDYSSSSDERSPFIIKSSDYGWTDGWALARNGTNEEITTFVDDYSTYGLVNSLAYNIPFMACQFKNADFLRLYIGGASVQVVSNTGFTNSLENMYVGVATSDTPGEVRQFLDGHIAEIIIFDDNLRSSERILVQNYLASKYGISTSQDRYSYDVTHSYEVFGIGRKNTANNFVGTAQGSGIVEISNASSLDDEEFLLIGHDNQDLTAQYEDVPPEYTYRVNRSWRVDERGDVGTLDVSFDVSGLGFSTNATEYALLIDTDGDFSDATIHTTGVSYNSGIVSFTGVDFPGDCYFSLAPYHSITWDGANYAYGTGTASAPNSSDSDRKMYVYGSSGSISSDCHIRNLVVSGAGSITVSGNAEMTVTNEILNEGSVTINNGASLVQTHSGSDENSGSGNYVIEREGQNSIDNYNGFSAPISSATLMTVFNGSNPCDVFVYEGNSQTWKHDFASGYSATCDGNPVTFGANSVIAGGDGQMDVARGYFVPGNASVTRSFSGAINNGDISIGIVQASNSGGGAWDGDDFNLLGNPYPSAIDASSFWEVNANDNSLILEALYFWDDDGSAGTGYDQDDEFAYWNEMGGTASSNSATIPNGYIASGQAFFVIANGTGSVTFNNEMRGGTNTQFFKREREANRVRFWLSGRNSFGDFSQTLIGFDDNTSVYLDPGYDSRRAVFQGKMYIGTRVDSTSLVIQGRPHVAFAQTEEIPLDVYASHVGVHIFQLDSIEDPLNKYSLSILDSKFGKVYPISNGIAGIYLSDTGRYENRFFLRVENISSMPNGVQDVSSVTNYFAWFNESKLLVSTDSPKNIKRIELFSLTGAKILEEEVNETGLSHEIFVPTISSGVYLVRLHLENEAPLSLQVIYP